MADEGNFGLPIRLYINRAFLTLALVAGLDGAILDSLDRESVYRAGLFGEPSAKTSHK